MHLVTFAVETKLGLQLRAGGLLGTAVIDLTLAYQALIASRRGLAGSLATSVAATEVPPDLLALLRLEEAGLENVHESLEYVKREGIEALGGALVRHDIADVRLLSPLPRPNSLRDFLAVEEHVHNTMSFDQIPAEWYKLPVHYKGNVEEVYGPEDEVPWPAYTEKLDYELEVAAVIGKVGRRISANRASQHIVGYTLFNDWSARDIQFREMSVKLGPALGKDFANSFGPCIATADEFDRDNAKLQARIDGEVWSTGTLGKMQFSFEEIIEIISQEQTLRPGDYLGSGTVGHGCGLELDRWLTEGCVVELEAEGIGVLRNRVGFKGAGVSARSRDDYL